ncbi:MAG: alpha/beta hydrolase, partial [Acidimicrobiia bacterium]|nr:alpha/beta hydrolase [Acidimicrobiia bacterium]
PSRFGYLGSAMPPRATVAAQSEAFALLLDHLELDAVDVIAVSAGTGAAIQLALRHPDRVKHLIVSSGNFPGSATAQAPPGWAKVFYSDRAMWTLKTAARPAAAGLMGVPAGFPRTDDDARQIDRMLDSIFPIAPRREGAVFDAYVSNPEIVDHPLEQIRVPTLIIHAEDDPLASFDAAVAASDRIPDAHLVALRSGGHLQLGQAERVRTEIAFFLTSAVIQSS